MTDRYRPGIAAEPAAGGMMIPGLLLLVAFGAVLIPVGRAYLALAARSPLQDPQGVAGDIQSALMAAWTSRFAEFVFPAIMLVVVGAIVAAYRLLSDFLGSRLGSWASLIPTVVLAAASLSSLVMTWYRLPWSSEGGVQATQTVPDAVDGKTVSGTIPPAKGER
jgi:hypothetical protein